MSNTCAFCQPLEARRLLAGNVQILIEANIVEISGDALDNALLIEFDQNEQAYRATGLEGTTVNGAAEDLFTISTADSGVDVELGDGRDQLIIRGLDEASRALTIDAGDGDDSILLEDSRLETIDYQGGLGKDWLGLYSVEATSFRGGGGGGRDTLEVRTASIGLDLFWNDRSGPGGLYIENAVVGNNIEFASIDTSAPDGPFNVWMELRDNTVGERLIFRTGPGNDQLLMRDNVLGEDPVIDLGDGDDDIDAVPPLT